MKNLQRKKRERKGFKESMMLSNKTYRHKILKMLTNRLFGGSY